MREELQTLLYENYGNNYNHIHTPYSIAIGPVYIRFDLGGNLKNGTVERVDQVVTRATKIFEEVFKDDNSIWVLCYEDVGEVILFEGDNEYLYEQFEDIAYTSFYKGKETLTSNFFEEDENGNSTSVPSTYDGVVIVGNPDLKDVNYTNIFKGRANLEMGLDPAISQRVYFISPTTGAVLYMYDDRGCDLVAPNTNAIRHVYENCNELILEYNRANIDTVFKK